MDVGGKSEAGRPGRCWVEEPGLDGRLKLLGARGSEGEVNESGIPESPPGFWI